MIPILIVVGLVLGRWWRTTMVVGVVGWVVVLLATGVIDMSGIPAAAALAAANTGVGVLLHLAVLQGVRQVRQRAGHPGAA